jgi:LDH2 family malate/lactate/ureidoglycolate dehydrogenase
MEKAIVKNGAELERLITQIFVAAGASNSNANDVAEHLVRAELSGVVTHGVFHVREYVRNIISEALVPDSSPEILIDEPSAALITGNWTFGQVAAKFATNVAIEKAKAHGSSVVSIVAAHHTGRLGHYVEMAAENRMISMVLSGGYSEVVAATVPYGGKRPVLHTNPMALGSPCGEESPMMFDWATTGIAGMKIVQARERGEQLPPGCIVDKDGIESTDPEDFYDGGAHLPFGKHKGYTLMMGAEFLGRIFSGSDDYVDARRAGDILRHQGVTFIVFRADLFQPFSKFAERADEMQQRVRKVPPAQGFNEVLAPGDLEHRKRQERIKDGVPLEVEIWESIVEAGKLVGVEVT